MLITHRSRFQNSPQVPNRNWEEVRTIGIRAHERRTVRPQLSRSSVVEHTTDNRATTVRFRTGQPTQQMEDAMSSLNAIQMESLSGL